MCNEYLIISIDADLFIYLFFFGAYGLVAETFKPQLYFFLKTSCVRSEIYFL